MADKPQMKKSTAEKLALATLVIGVIGIIALFFFIQFYPIYFTQVIALVIALVFLVFSLAALAVPVWITYTIYVPAPRNDPSMGPLMEGCAHFAGGLAFVLFFGLMIASGGPMVIPGFLQVTKPMICPAGFEESRSQLVIRQYDSPGLWLGADTTETCSGELGNHEVSNGIKVLGGFLAYLIYCGLYFAVVFVVRKQKLFALQRYAAQGIILALFIALLSVTLLNPPVRAAIARPINGLLYRGHAVSLVEAVKRHKVDMIRDLLARGGNIYAKNDHNETALAVAQRYEDREVIALFASRITGGSASKQALLDKGIVYDESNFLEQVKKGNVGNVGLFLDAGMDINSLIKHKSETALTVAAESGHKELVQYLLDRKADINKRNAIGWTPLLSAAITSSKDYNCRGDIVQLLLKRGAKVSAVTRDGDTALLFASQVGCIDAVKALVEHGADINARTKDGYSALLYAVEHPAYKGDNVHGLEDVSYDMVKYLLEHGADPNVNIYRDGRTPLRIAKSWNVKLREAKKVAELLEQYNARD